MCEILVVGSQQDVGLLHAVDTWLRLAGIAVEVAEISVSRSDPSMRNPRTLVAVIPQESDPERRTLIRSIREATNGGTAVIAVARPDDHVPLPPRSLLNIVRMGVDPHSLRSRLLESILDPSPFRSIAVPGITAPTGVAGWTSTQLIVSCDDSGRVVSVDSTTGRTITLMTGLLEPHGVSVDRRTLLVTAKGSNSVVTGELLDGRFAPGRELGLKGVPSLARPHLATQLGGEVLIVDTDHHRLLRANGSVLTKLGRFEEMSIDTELRNPCGAAFFHGAIAVADTFNDRLVIVRDGHGMTNSDLGFPAPVQVALAPDGTLAIVATDGLHLIEIQLGMDSVKVKKRRHIPAGGNNPLRTPFGVTVDRTGKIYVADRGRGLVWVAEMDELLQKGRRAA